MYSNFDAQFALANVLYTESKKYYKYVDNQLIISGNSEFISIILTKYPRVLDILKHASSMDEIFNLKIRLLYKLLLKYVILI